MRVLREDGARILRELLVHCRSARERSGRLLLRRGNVYKLLVPPG